MFTYKAIDSLQTILKNLEPLINTANRDVSRYELTDRYVQKTGDYTDATLKGEQVNELGDKSKIRNVEIPITFIQKETAHAYLTGTFLSGYPIFAATASRQNEDGAAQLNVLTARDQDRFGWTGDLLRCMDDVLKYNKCAAEVLWDTRRAISAKTKIQSGPNTTPNTASPDPIIYEGNHIRRLDPYNLILDPNVEPAKNHIDGTLAGYIEVKDYIGMKRQYLNWNSLYTVKKNIEKIFQAQQGENYTTYYYVPKIRKDTRINSPTQNWANFWGNAPTIPMINSTGRYESVTLFIRIIPKEYHLDVPQSGNPQVYKLVWVNGHLAYVEPVSAGHEYLPIVVGQMYPGNTDVKSYVEYVQDLQDLATSMMTGTLDSMRRAVNDRAIYDPTRISKRDVENPNPSQKIPLLSNVYGQTIDQAYKSIPYDDRISGNFSANMSTAMNLANLTTGNNPSAQGSFIKGNKTMNEFDTIMSKSEARLQLGAVALQNSFFNPIKTIIKLNFFLYAQSEEIENMQTGNMVTIQPEVLRKIAPDYKMADGIMPTTKIANTEVIMQTVNTFSMLPDLALEYDIGGMLVSVMKQQGFSEMGQYKRTPEQQQQYLQMVAARGAAENAGSQSADAGEANQGGNPTAA